MRPRRTRMAQEQPIPGAAPVAQYARDHRVLMRALRSRGRRNAMDSIHRFLSTTGAHNEAAHQLVRSVLHALGERRLPKEKITLLKQLLLARPDISTWHLLGALKVEGKTKAGKIQRVGTIRELFRHDAFVNPLTVRAAMGAYYDQRVGNHVRNIFRQRQYLDHDPTARELAHNLTYMLTRHKNSGKLVRPYIAELAAHDGFFSHMQAILKDGKIEYTFGSRRQPKTRRMRLSMHELNEIRLALDAHD